MPHMILVCFPRSHQEKFQSSKTFMLIHMIIYVAYFVTPQQSELICIIYCAIYHAWTNQQRTSAAFKIIHLTLLTKCIKKKELAIYGYKQLCDQR